MALDTLTKFPDCGLKIVPVGLNYFNGHRFRSRVFVDFAEPIEISPDLVRRFKEGGKDKRAACSELLSLILDGLASVTLQAPTWHQLELMQMFRRLYLDTSQNQGITMEDQQTIVRSFQVGYEQVQERPDVVKVREHVQRYQNLLKQYGLQDHQVAKRISREHDGGDTIDTTHVLELLVTRSMISAAYAFSFLPGIILAAPCILITKYVAKKKQAEALAKSSVKIKAQDVIATWKIMIGLCLIPLLHMAYTLCVWWYFGGSAAVVYFFFMPFLSAGSILAYENFQMCAKSLKPLYLLLCKPRGTEELLQLRKKSAKEVRGLVDKLGWISGDPPSSPDAADDKTTTGRGSFGSQDLELVKKTHSWTTGYMYDWLTTPDY